MPTSRRACPLPPGEGVAERRVRELTRVKTLPHPALRATFSRREKVSRPILDFLCKAPSCPGWGFAYKARPAQIVCLLHIKRRYGVTVFSEYSSLFQFVLAGETNT